MESGADDFGVNPDAGVIREPRSGNDVRPPTKISQGQVRSARDVVDQRDVGAISTAPDVEAFKGTTQRMQERWPGHYALPLTNVGVEMGYSHVSAPKLR